MNLSSTPLWVRKFVLDFVETSIGLILALNLAFPTSVADAKQVGIIVGAAVLSAITSAIRRVVPAFLVWLATKLGTNTGTPSAGDPGTSV